MRLTFCYISIRNGGIDILSTCLRHQISEPDWNLVVVDGFPGRVERGFAENCLLSEKIPLRAYVEPKPKTFPWSRTGFANAINTAALHADGDWVIYLHDYTIYPADMVKLWKRVISEQEPKTLIHGIGQNMTTSAPDKLGDVTTWEKSPELMFRDPWIPTVFELGYFGFPMSFLDEGNGLDERADFCFTFPTRSVVTKARLLGYKLHIDQRLVCGMIDHHLWELPGDRTTFHKSSHWRIPGEYSDVPEEPSWTVWSANPMKFEEERKHIAAKLDCPVRVHPLYHYLPEKREIT